MILAQYGMEECSYPVPVRRQVAQIPQNVCTNHAQGGCEGLLPDSREGGIAFLGYNPRRTYQVYGELPIVRPIPSGIRLFTNVSVSSTAGRSLLISVYGIHVDGAKDPVSSFNT